MIVSNRISDLRAAMAEHRLDAYLVPTTDPHQSEYPAPRWAGREYLSGFTGSAGTLVVTAHEAKLWTDGRYYLQAETELAGSGIGLMRAGEAATPTPAAWLTETLLDGQTVGLDGRVNSVHTVARIRKKLANGDLELNTDHDLIELVWKDRPGLPNKPVAAHDEKYAGEKWTDRLRRLVDWMGDNNLDYYLVTALDEIAWLLNLRGADVDFNPLVVSYFVAGRSGDHAIFAEQGSQLTEWAGQMPAGHRLEIRPYAEIGDFLQRKNAEDADLGLDPATTPYDLYLRAGAEGVSRYPSPLAGWKAIKNAVAIDHLRQTMREDARALQKLIDWLPGAIERGVTEYGVGEQLSEFRAESELYRGDSFPAIVGYRGDGAIIHYRAKEETAATLAPNGLLLIDSGGHYAGGTTDITRTISLGEPTEEERYHFTLVLMGHIDLATAKFPVGTAGIQLDALARMPLWRAGLNYGHGTGHGIGYYLNVHEGPAGISAKVKSPLAQRALEAGMVLSNEPGLYLEGKYGIRIENLMLVKEAEEAGFLEFETLTRFPLQESLIDRSLLNAGQTAWLDDYQREVAQP